MSDEFEVPPVRDRRVWFEALVGGLVGGAIGGMVVAVAVTYLLQPRDIIDSWNSSRQVIVHK